MRWILLSIPLVRSTLQTLASVATSFRGALRYDLWLAWLCQQKPCTLGVNIVPETPCCQNRFYPFWEEQSWGSLQRHKHGGIIPVVSSLGVAGWGNLLLYPRWQSLPWWPWLLTAPRVTLWPGPQIPAFRREVSKWQNAMLSRLGDSSKIYWPFK